MATENKPAANAPLECGVRPSAWLWTDINGDTQVNVWDAPMCPSKPLYDQAALDAAVADERKHVRIPRCVAEAKAMATVAIAWLRENAPDELRHEFRA